MGPHRGPESSCICFPGPQVTSMGPTELGQGGRCLPTRGTEVGLALKEALLAAPSPTPQRVHCLYVTAEAPRHVAPHPHFRVALGSPTPHLLFPHFSQLCPLSPNLPFGAGFRAGRAGSLPEWSQDWQVLQDQKVARPCPSCLQLPQCLPHVCPVCPSILNNLSPPCPTCPSVYTMCPHVCPSQRLHTHDMYQVQPARRDRPRLSFSGTFQCLRTEL